MIVGYISVLFACIFLAVILYRAFEVEKIIFSKKEEKIDKKYYVIKEKFNNSSQRYHYFIYLGDEILLVCDSKEKAIDVIQKTKEGKMKLVTEHLKEIERIEV